MLGSVKPPAVQDGDTSDLAATSQGSFAGRIFHRNALTIPPTQALSGIELECDRSQVFLEPLSQRFKKHITDERGYHGNFKIRSGKNISECPKQSPLLSHA